MRSLGAFAVGAAVLAGVFGVVTPAQAGPGDQVGTGPTGGGNTLGAQATYQVHLSGDLKSGSTSMSVGVPPTCWWAPTGQNAAQYSQYYEDYAIAQRPFGSEVWYGMPHPGQVTDAVNDEKAGNAGQWYGYTCRDGITLDVAFRAQYGLGTYQENPVFPVWYQWVRNGQPVPPGYVAPEDLLEIVMRYIRLLPPTIGRSPGGDAITQLPTWLWVTADDAKVKRVRAEAGPVWVEVTAPSQGITFSAPYAGSTTCAPAAATTAYTAGASGSSCTLTWVRASWEGTYTLTATNTWYATYTASDGSGGAVPNQPAPQTSTEQVRVVETQVVGAGTRWTYPPN